MTMLAVLALLASVLMWATPQAAAQSGNDVVAVTATVSRSSDDASATDEVTVEAGQRVYLDGTATLINGDDPPATSYKWEIADGPYDWLTINQDAETSTDNDSDIEASFLLPNQNYVDGVTGSDDQKYKIQVTLTATRNGSSESDTVTITIARPPVADITVFAGLPDSAFADDVNATFEEIFGEDAIIDGPGENGNRDNEWDIREKAYLRLDGSGSTVPGGKVDRYRWERLSPPNLPTGVTLTSAPIISGPLADTDINPIFVAGNNDFTAEAASGTYTILPDLNAGEISVKRLTLIYQLSVQSGGGTAKTSRVRIVVHDSPAEADPIGVSVSLAAGSQGSAPQSTLSALNGGVENQYLVSAGSVVQFTVTGLLNEKLTWTGATARGDVDLLPPNNPDGTDDSGTATRRVPSGVTAGTTYDVTVTDGDRTTTVQLLVGANQVPTASPIAGVSLAEGQTLDRISAGQFDLAVLSVNDGVQSNSKPITLRGVGNDPDGGAIIQAWTLRHVPADSESAVLGAIDTWLDPDGNNKSTAGNGDVAGVVGPVLLQLSADDPADPLVELINPIGDGEVSFEVPQVRADTGVFLTYSVVDSANVLAARVLYLRIEADDDKPVANAGTGQQVASGAFVRLDGSGSADPDPGDSIAGSHSWTYVGANMSPLPDARRALSDAEIGQLDGWVLRQVTTDNPLPDGDTRKTFKDSEGNDYVYIVDAKGDLVASEVPEGGHTGKLMESGSAYPYFTAPKLTGFNNLGLTFHLTVTDGQGTTTGDDPTADDDKSDPSPVTITVARVASNEFYSGVITGPGFCTNLAFGGPMLFAHDGDGDGVAETCSLNTTRRATIARQNALEAIAALNPTALDNAIDAECGKLVAGNASYEGDEPADLAGDACADASNPVAVIPVLSGATAYGPTVNGPAFCSNFSLGGPIMYPYDSDGDGVYDICSLNSTRREAVARQTALAISFEVSFSAGDQTRHDELVELRELQELGDDRTDDQDTRHIDLITKYEGGFTDSTDGALDSDEIIALSAEIDSLAAAKSAAARYANALAAACRALAGQVFEGDKAADLATDECVRPTTSGIALPSGS
ncbi:MAG: hypothetical protein OXE93_02740 [bacterium]|nr:hypothetical protein [bacterium]